MAFAASPVRASLLPLVAVAALAGATAGEVSAAASGALPRILEEDDSCPAGSAACALSALQYSGSEPSAARRALSAAPSAIGDDASANATSAEAALQLAAAAAAFQGLDFERVGSGACVAQSFIGRVQRKPFKCSTVKKISATDAQMPAFVGCHTQGIAVDEATGGVVITCEDMSVIGAKGRVGVWPKFVSGAQASVVKGGTGALFTQIHPSATQMLEGVVPVFYANPLDVGPSTLYFYQVSSGRLSGPVGQAINHPESHMGAVGFAKVSANYVVVACGWDCKQFGVWASRTGPTSGYQRTFYTSDSSTMVIGSAVGDKDVNAYNSLYLAVDCSTGEPYLFATFKETLDVWHIDGLLSASPKMTKVAQRTVAQSHIFYEGFTMLPSEDGQDATIYAMPTNFHSCGFGKECADAGYICRFR